MKRAMTLIASLFIVVTFAGGAAAEMVNIGTVAIDKADYNGIREQVAGVKTTAPVVAVPRPAQVNVGAAQFDADEHATLQDYVSGRKEIQARPSQAPRDKRANIGVVDMSQADLQDLEKLTSWMKGKRPGQLLTERLHAEVK